MRTAVTILRMVVRRSLANRRLLSTVVVGVVMAAALMASVVLYSDAIRDLGLRHTLEKADPLDRNIRVMMSGRPALPDYQAKRDTVERTLDSHAGEVIGERVHYGRSATFYLAAPGEPAPEEESRPRAHFQFADELEKHTRLVAGRLPGEPAEDGRPVIEVLIGQAAAAQLGLQLGDRFDLHPFWREDLAPVGVTIVGFIEPNDITEPYWFGKTDRFVYESTSWQTYPFWVPEATVDGALARYLADMEVSVETYGLVDIGRINSRNARRVEDGMNALDRAIREAVSGAISESKLGEIVGSYRTKLFYTRLPLFALMLQVVGIAMYYLVMVSTMLVERQAGEIALLRSRGGSARQVVAIYAIEGLIICGLAAVVGPLIAAAGIGVLGYTPPFESLSGNARIEVPLSRGAFGLAALGALLAFAALLWPAWRAARNSTIDYKHGLARPQTQPLFLRYYLDLVLVAIGAFLFYQLRERGSLVTERLFGDLSADPLLLLSPTLFMLMVALVFLRLFPVALRGAAWAARRLDSATVNLGLSRMTRAPMHYSRLILLLLLATAVGMFAAGYRATLERGYDDRAAFIAGAPSRLENVKSPLGLSNEVFVERIQGATGAEAVSPVARLQGSYSTGTYQSETVTALGVVAGEFEDVAYWRDDFAGEPLGELLARLPLGDVERAAAKEVPAGARYIGLWANLPLTTQQGRPGIRLREADGTVWEYNLDPAPQSRPDGWRFFVADLTRPLQVRFNPAMVYRPGTAKELESVFVRLSGSPPQVPERIIATVDDVQISMAAQLAPDVYTAGFADAQVVEDFASIERYELISGASIGDPGAFSLADGAGRDGSAAARLAFTRGQGASPVSGLRLRRAEGPLPVLASSRFAEISGKGTGDEGTVYINRQYVQFRIAGVFELFPGHDPSRSDALLVADLAALQELAAKVPSLSDAVYANEAWMSAATPGVMTRETLLPKGINADAYHDWRDIRAAQGADPLVAASWEGILFLCFAAVLILTGLGFAVYATLAVQARSLEFAILRTMGFSNLQVLGLVSFEQLFVIAGGVVAGTFLGFPLGRLMIGYLGVTESGDDPVPPLVSQVSWPSVLTVYGLLAVVFICTILSLATVYSRLAVSRTLRIGEI